ncbi:DNA replication and repair protein RecF [Desulfitispora alkaliphila]|uniref:DNA replication/repair protein RecF n=1 Tax=Desulfitispora alkaliphila TaxID=622674 RepID=UPI003D1F5310
MLVNNIHLECFRNYKKLDLSLEAMLVILVGENAQGKTNLLESIYYLSRGSAHRSNRDKDLINWNESYFKILAHVSREDYDYRLGFTYDEKGKKLTVNGVKRSRIGEASDYFNTVIFAPEDLKILKGSPSERRNYLDSLISQLNPQYNYYLTQYNKVLYQRNNLLKKLIYKRESVDTLVIWDSQLSFYGSRILVKRFDYLNRLMKNAQVMHSSITNSRETLDIKYNSSLTYDISWDVNKIQQGFEERLVGERNNEIKRGTTLVGPHRDDFTVTVNQREVKVYGSQGQQRTCVLSLKLAELEMIYEEKDSYPLLLLDDVMSELDESRRNFLLKLTKGKVQTIITTTDLNALPQSSLKEALIYIIKSGSAKQLNFS